MSRRKFSIFLFLQQLQDFGVLDLLFRRPDRAFRFFNGIHQLLVVGQAGRVIQQVSNGNRFSVRRKIGKDFRERLVVAELSVLDQEHGGHRRELLGERSKTEIRAGVDLHFRTGVRHTVTALENALPILVDQYSEAG